FALVARAPNVERLVDAFVAARLCEAEKKDRLYLDSCYPGLTLPPDCVVLVSADARYFTPQALTTAFLRRACATKMAQCLQGTEISDVRQHDRELVLMASDGREIYAQHAVLATGPWITGGPAGSFCRDEGVKLKKVVAMHVECPPKENAPVIYLAEEDAFLFPHREQNRFLLSIASAEWDCLPEISQLRITPSDRILATSILERYCPSFVRHCTGGRVFCDAYSKDCAPLISHAPGLDRLVVAGACSGSGMRLAPAVAMEALQLSGVCTREVIHS
ncbi:MAG: NAD(P)/FAD-dependent oxidoreductase, partial [Candidatus Angelobacter sp.]